MKATTLRMGKYLYVYHGKVSTRQLWKDIENIPDYQFQVYRSITLENDVRRPNHNIVYLFEHEQLLQKTLHSFMIETRHEFGVIHKDINDLKGDIIDLRQQVKDLRKYVDKKFREESSTAIGKFFNSLGKGMEEVGKDIGKFANKVLDKGVKVLEKVIDTGERIINKGIDAAHDVADSALDVIKLPLMILAGTLGTGIITYFIFKVYKDQPRQRPTSR